MRTLHCLHLLFVVETVPVELPHLFVAHHLALPAGLNWHLHVLGSIISVVAAVVIVIVTSTMVWNFIAKFFSQSEEQ